jgi:signal transduction histidine kinase
MRFRVTKQLIGEFRSCISGKNLKKRMNSRIFLKAVFFLLLLHGQALYANDSIQILKAQISEDIPKTEKVKLLLDLSEKLAFSKPSEGLEYGKQAITLSAELGNNKFYMQGLILAGKNSLYAGQFDSALVFLHRARAIKVAPEFAKHHINALILLGTCYNQRLNYDSAYFYYQKSLDLAIEEDNARYLAAIYNNLGTLADGRGRLHEAFEYYLKSLAYYEEIGDKQNQAITLNNIGLLNQNLGDLQRAVDYTKRAAAINEEIKSYYHLSTNYGNLGSFYQEMKIWDEAEKYILLSHKISSEQGFILDEARALLNLGSVYLNNSNLEKAKKAFNESLQLCIDNGITYGIMLNYFNMVDVYMIEEDYERAEIYLDKTLEIASDLGQDNIVKQVYSQKSDIYEHTGRYADALRFQKKFQQLSDSLNKLANKEHIQELQTRYETEKKELDNQRLRAENESKARIIQVQKLTVAAIVLILVLLALLTWVSYRSRKRIQVANNNLNELNNKILQQNKKLEELNSSKDKLFSVIAHDLRSPFNSLLGFLQMFLDDFDSFKDTEKKEMMELLYQQGNNTFSLLENLLQWSMAQRGQIQFNPEIYDLHQLAESEIEYLATRAARKEITIENNIQPNTMAWVDDNLVKIIFRNVINNSIKFTKAEGIIEIDSEVERNKVTIKVADNGIGMSDEKITELFETKIASSSKGTANEAGTGLGLILVKEFAELNHASLKVESIKNEGTVFSITFRRTPLVPAVKPDRIASALN